MDSHIIMKMKEYSDFYCTKHFVVQLRDDLWMSLGQGAQKMYRLMDRRVVRDGEDWDSFFYGPFVPTVHWVEIEQDEIYDITPWPWINDVDPRWVLDNFETGDGCPFCEYEKSRAVRSKQNQLTFLEEFKADIDKNLKDNGYPDSDSDYWEVA